MGVVFSPSSNSFHRKVRGKGGGESIMFSVCTVYGVFRFSGPEAEFMDVSGKKVLRVFLLAIHSHFY
jgi:hypothetical protein